MGGKLEQGRRLAKAGPADGPSRISVLIDFFMKLFKTRDINIVEMCQVNFSFRLPSDILHDRTKKLLDKITIGN